MTGREAARALLLLAAALAGVVAGLYAVDHIGWWPG